MPRDTARSADWVVARNAAFHFRKEAGIAAFGRRCPVFAALAYWATADFRDAQAALDRASRPAPGRDGLYRY